LTEYEQQTIACQVPNQWYHHLIVVVVVVVRMDGRIWAKVCYDYTRLMTNPIRGGW